jgi:hypothetical protein
MSDYILFMHNDGSSESDSLDWNPYLASLRSAGAFQGGSAIGAGKCMRRSGQVPDISERIVGFIRVEAKDLDQVRELLIGNPVFEAGGTVEIRELPRTD